jgi:hypothetical protein
MAIVLHQFPISHYCEKVRWALDYKGVDYRLKNHLPGLATALWQSVTSTVVPPNLSLSVPVPEAVDEPESTPSAPADAPTASSGMSLNVDLAGMLRNLFQPKAEPAEAPDDGDDDEGDDA